MRFAAKVMAALGVFVTMSAGAASFDCARASTQTERAICASAQLSNLDSQLAGAYQAAKANSASIPPVELAQRAWLAQVRDKCTDETCLARAYEDRIAVLSGSPTRAEIEAEDANPPPGSSDQSKSEPHQAMAAPEVTASVGAPPAAPQSVAPDQATSAALQSSAIPVLTGDQRDTPAPVAAKGEATPQQPSIAQNDPQSTKSQYVLIVALVVSLLAWVSTMIVAKRRRWSKTVGIGGGGVLAAALLAGIGGQALQTTSVDGKSSSSPGTASELSSKADGSARGITAIQPFDRLSIGMPREEAGKSYRLEGSTPSPLAQLMGMNEFECASVAGSLTSGRPGLQFKKMSLCFDASTRRLVKGELTIDESSKTDSISAGLKESIDRSLGVESIVNASGVWTWTVSSGNTPYRVTFFPPGGLITFVSASGFASGILPAVTSRSQQAKSDNAQQGPRETVTPTAHRYTALVTCSSGGTNVTVLGCFEDTELRISRANRSQAFNISNLSQAGEFDGVTLKVALGDSFSLRAQNSHVVLALGVKISDETGKVVFEDQRATRGGVIAVKSD